jgi:hypothetical protein
MTMRTQPYGSPSKYSKPKFNSEKKGPIKKSKQPVRAKRINNPMFKSDISSSKQSPKKRVKRIPSMSQKSLKQVSQNSLKNSDVKSGI